MTKDEEEIVLKAYHQCTGGWDEILEFIKSQVALMPGNYLKKQKTVEYYNNAEKKAAIKRVQRIVSQNLKKASQDSGPSTSNTKSQPSTSQSMTQMIAKSKMRYARKATPEERRLSKFAHAASVQSSDSCGEEPPVDPSGDVEDRPAAAEASGSDSPPRKAPKKKGQKGKKRREKLAREANQAHAQMCNKAMRMMDKINSVLEKFDDTDSD